MRPGFDERALASSVAHVADQMGLAPDWLNNAVGMFTPLLEDDCLFEVSGNHPETGSPGLRVFLAKPFYLLGMKLKVLTSLDRGKRIWWMPVRSRWKRGTDVEALHRLYVSIHDEKPPHAVTLRFDSVLKVD